MPYLLIVVLLQIGNNKTFTSKRLRCNITVIFGMINVINYIWRNYYAQTRNYWNRMDC